MQQQQMRQIPTMGGTCCNLILPRVSVREATQSQRRILSGAWEQLSAALADVALNPVNGSLGPSKPPIPTVFNVVLHFRLGLWRPLSLCARST